jgi:succinoglycan biosynthesis protein ExoO
MLVSVIIPACDARATLARALASLKAQVHPQWEAIVVSDDGTDYAAWLAGIGMADPRIRHATTGRIRSGCHNARNAGLAVATGDMIAALDADDLFRPERLARLVPLAMRHGAIADNLVLESETTGAVLGHAMAPFSGVATLSLEDILALNAPLAPLVRRDYAEPRWSGIELAEDVVANLRLASALAGLPAIAEAGYVYRIVEGSICHDLESAARFDRAYGAYVARVETGDAFGLADAHRVAVARGLRAKREVNRRFALAQASAPALTFPEFAAALAAGRLRPSAAPEPT